MSTVREKLSDALLNGLAPFFPCLERSDLYYFGDYADVSVPIMQKYGLDITEEIVYNIKSSVMYEENKLFSDAREERGFLNIILSDDAISALMQSVTDNGLHSPSDRIEIGCCVSFIHARLLDAAFQDCNDTGIPAFGCPARRALLQCILADSPESLNIALRNTDLALRIDRRSRFEGSTGILDRAAALAMASALEKFLN